MNELGGALGRDADGQELAAWFAAASTHLSSGTNEEITWDRIVASVLAVVPGQWCGMTLRRRRGRLTTVCPSDALVSRCDELQYELSEGPCLESAVEGVGFLVRDTEQDPRWPRWGPAVAELGVRSAMSLQLVSHVGEGHPEVLGAINVYHSQRNAFSRDDFDRGLVYASHAAQALSTVRQLNGLESAIHSRHTIGLAQGILMERYQLTVAAAFDLLQRTSNEQNVKLRDLATRVVETRSERTPSTRAEHPDASLQKGPDGLLGGGTLSDPARG